MKKIISFSLYGNKPNFQIGAIVNTIEAARVYPDWQCRFYTTDNDTICKQLEYLGAEIVRMDDWPEGQMLWRFLAVDDADVCLSRDADSVVNEREAAAVNEWLEETSHQWHAMHDWKGHRKISMMGGMWGYRHYEHKSQTQSDRYFFNFREKSMRQLIDEWSTHSPCSGRGWDQEFLGKVIYAGRAQKHNIKWSGDWVNAKGNHFPPHYPIRYGRFVGDYTFWEGGWEKRVHTDKWLIDAIKQMIKDGWDSSTIPKIMKSVKSIIYKCGGRVQD